MQIWQPDHSLEESLRRLEDQIGAELSLRSTWRELLLSRWDSWTTPQIALAAATLPILRARLADLLWEARYGNRPADFARKAATSYAKAASSVWEDSSPESDSNRRAAAVRCLRRARDLTRAINDPDSSDLLHAVCSALAGELSHDQPDIWLPAATDLFEICTSMTTDADLGTLDKPLARILAFASDSPLHWEWQLECELAVAKRRCEPAENVVTRHVQAKLVAAKEAKDYVHRMRLLDFAEAQMSRARDPALSLEVRREMEATEMPMVEAKFSVPLPAEAMEAMMADIVRDDSAANALERLALTAPIAWSDEQISAQIQEMSDHAQFLDLVSIRTLDVRGNATSSVTTDEQRAAFKERWVRTWLISFSAATITGLALTRIRDRYRGDDGVPDLAGFFAAAWPDSWIVDGLCRAFQHHFNGLHEEAVMLALRRIEWIARDLLAACGGVTTTPMQGDRPGGVKGLGDILRALREHLDPDFATWLDLALTNPTASNLRGRYFHALRDGSEFPKNDAALALQAVLYLWRDRIQRNAAQAAEREDPDTAAV